MSSDVDILKQMLKENVIVPIGKEVVLSELRQKDCSVKICKVPGTSIVFRADSFDYSEKIFRGSKNEGKRADFILFSEYHGKTYVICIELKKDDDDNQVIEKQLMGAYCLAVYLQEIGKLFWREKTFLDTCEYRYICFTKRKLNKRVTKVKQTTPKHGLPRDFLKISRPHGVQFNELVS